MSDIFGYRHDQPGVSGGPGTAAEYIPKGVACEVREDGRVVRARAPERDASSSPAGMACIERVLADRFAVGPVTIGRRSGKPVEPPPEGEGFYGLELKTEIVDA